MKVQHHEVHVELPRKLKLRGQWFKPGSRFGVNISFANKRKLVAVVGTRANWIALVEKGGIKRPTKKVIAIPSSNIDTSRPRKKAEKPSSLIRKGAFIAKLKSGKVAIFTRVGKTQIKPLYFFGDRADVPDLLDFNEAGRTIVNSEYIPAFTRELQRAIATAK